MASTYRFYRAARIGSGVALDPYRSALRRYITGSNGTFWSLNAVGVAGFYDLAFCDSTVHAQCAVDADVTILSPEQTLLSDLSAWLDGQIGSLSAAVTTAIEGDGIPLDDLATTAPRRALLRRIGMHHQVVGLVYDDLRVPGRLLGPWKDGVVSDVPASVRSVVDAYLASREMSTAWITGATPVMDVVNWVRDARIDTHQWFLGALSRTVAEIQVTNPARVTRFAQWMRSVGLDTSWIVGTTTVRAIVKRIASDLALPPLDIAVNRFERVRF